MSPAAAAEPVWVLHTRHSPERAADLARAYPMPLAVAHALVNRGMDTAERARHYLEPSIEDLHDPREMRDLDRAAERILKAIADGERVFIQGDYDVDGITSTFLLHDVLKEELRGSVEYRIPHRINDGYGLTGEAIDAAQRLGCTLVVTVDCGITASEAVARGNALGIDTVITDHHPPQATLPDAYAIVNPMRADCDYPFKKLAGVGVTFKLVERLLQGRGGLDRARDYLDVVALGTIADVVPLVGENRILARLGLDQLNLGRRLGLLALAREANLKGARISSGQVAFVLAPRINAAGRMGNAEQGLRLLMARDEGEARACAESLEEENLRRRQLDEKVLTDAVERVQRELNYPECSSILLWNQDWHAGVIGIVASRLVERFQRPAVLIALSGEGGRGSGRSLPGLDLTELLGGCSDLLAKFGGHAFAAGLTILRGEGEVLEDKLQELRARFEQQVRGRCTSEQFTRRLHVDAELRLDECDDDLVGWLERLAPHGLDNPEPMFQINGVRVLDVTRVAKDKHVRFTACDGNARVEAIGFGMGHLADGLRAAGRADLVGLPTRNEWKGETHIQLKLQAVRLPGRAHGG